MTLLPIFTIPSANSALVHSKNARQASSTVKSATVISPASTSSVRSSRTTPLAVPSQQQISQYN